MQLSHQRQTTASRHQLSTAASQPPPTAVRQVSAEAKLCQTAFCSIEAVRNGVGSQLQSLLSIGSHSIALLSGIELEDFRSWSQLQLCFLTFRYMSVSVMRNSLGPMAIKDSFHQRKCIYSSFLLNFNKLTLNSWPICPFFLYFVLTSVIERAFFVDIIKFWKLIKWQILNFFPTISKKEKKIISSSH